MSKMKLALLRMVSFWDIIIGGIISWVIKKFLDFIWIKSKPRLRFEGGTHIDYFSFGLDRIRESTFSHVYMPFLIKRKQAFLQLGKKQTFTIPEGIREYIRDCLIGHRRLHEYGVLKKNHVELAR